MSRVAAPLALAALCCLTGADALAQDRPATRRISFTTSEGTWLSLDVSPDGGTIIFELLGDLYTMPATGGPARRIVSGPAFESQPRFSPDGRSIVYVSDASGSDNVWVSAPDGSAPRALTTRKRAAMQSPAWSADGAAVYVTLIDANAPRMAEIHRVDVRTGEDPRTVANENGPAAPLISSPAPGAYSATLTADGRQLLYTSVTPRPYGSRNGASSAIVARDLATGTVTRLVLDGTNPMKPALSRDGRTLVYAATLEGTTALKARDLSTGQERWLHRGLQRHQLEARADRDVLPNYALTPDGRSVIIEIDGRLHRIGIADGRDTVIPFTADVAMEVPEPATLALRVDTGAVQARRIEHVAIAPDGRRIAFSTMARLFVTSSRGGRPTRLTRTNRPREFMPAFSPDGRWVAFVSWDETGGALWKTRSDGSGAPIRLSGPSEYWIDPVWTPEGTAVVAITAPRASTRQTPTLVPPDARVVRVPAGGGIPQPIAAAGGLRRPRFGPDSARLYLSSPGGAGASMLLNGTDRRPEPRVPSPTSALVSDATPVVWQRDGTPAAWVRGMTLLQRTGASGVDSVRLDISVPRARATGSIVFRGATVITMRADEVIPNADVIVQDDRITAVGARGASPVPAGARIIDVTGRTIVPGFIDVHAHLSLRSELLEPEGTSTYANLAYGITTVRDPQSLPDVFSVADIIEADGVPAPRMLSTGPALGFGAAGPGSVDYQSIDDVRREIRTYRDAYRTRYLKSYLAGNRQQRQWIVQASREAGIMPTTEGGADTKEDITHALDGYSGNEHAFPVAPIHDDLVQFIARAGIAYTPTLLVSFGGALPIYRLLATERPHEQRVSDWYPEGELYQRSSTRLLAFPPQDYNDREVGAGAAAVLRAGGLVALGGHGEVQGLSNHWEMQLLAAGGMTPHEVLRVATLNGARALGLDRDLGSIEPGKLADLVILDRNPLSDIRNTTAVRMIMRGGALYDAGTLQQVHPTSRALTPHWTLQRDPVASGVATAAIDRVVTQLMDSLRSPGVAVSVLRGTDVLLSKGYGTANIEQQRPVTPETMFESGSVGKQFTAAGVMTLVEAGRIRLDESIRAYFPDAPTPWQAITVRHLLTHTSGIPDYTSDQLDYRRAYSEEQLRTMAYALPLEFEAGARWNYSNTGYVILGFLIQRITGRPYWEYLRERIFTPAGMPTVRIISESDVVPHRASGYLLDASGQYVHQAWVSPEMNTTADGSLLLSLRDMEAWARTVHRRGILTEASWALLLGPVTLRSGRPYPYGMGWFIDSLRGRQVLQHGGAWQGFRTQITRFTTGDLTVIVLGNSRTTSADVIANAVAAAVDPALLPEPAPTEPIEDREPAATAAVRAALIKAASNTLSVADFSSVRQTTFPRLQAFLARALTGLTTPDALVPLRRTVVGDDVAYVYRATYGARRLQVRVSLAPDGRLAALMVSPEP